jgi:hypothetical protein
VKPLCADDSVAGCHVKVGHRQALILKSPVIQQGFFFDSDFFNEKLNRVNTITRFNRLI